LVIAIKEAASKMDFRADGSNIKKKKPRNANYENRNEMHSLPLAVDCQLACAVGSGFVPS
jgi:hypothetical protein